MRCILFTYVISVLVQSTLADDVDALEETKRDLINNYDKQFNFNCPHGKAISYIGSVHSNHHEDRLWYIRCNKYVQSPGARTWTSFVNDFDGAMNFECPGGNVIAGMGGYHSNKHEDRRFQFLCAHMRHKHKVGCHWTHSTQFDAQWQFDIPSGYYLTGMRSHHDNHHEDRIFSIQYCRFQ